MQRMEFPASFVFAVLDPKEGEEQPTLGAFAMFADKLPFVFVFETADPEWLNALAKSLNEAALVLTQNPLNAPFIGQQLIEDPKNVVIELAPEVDAQASNSPTPAVGESE